MLEVAEALRHHRFPTCSLCEGSAGAAVLFAHLARRTGAEADRRAALRLLQEAVAGFGAESLDASLYAGVAGVAWAAGHVAEVLDVEVEHPGEVVDPLLADYVPVGTDCYDLIAGLVGVGLYALDRVSSEPGRRCAERVVERLAYLAEPESGGLTWPTPGRWVPEPLRRHYPAGLRVTGMAHGVSGVLAFLAAGLTRGVAEKRCRTLVEGGAAWLLAQRLPPGSRSAFPIWTWPGVPSEASRLGWCSGDLGPGWALLQAGRALSCASLEQEGLGILMEAAERPLSLEHRDASLCHGTAGIAHVFSRVYRMTGEPRLRQAAEAWLAATLRLRDVRHGVAGFHTLKLPGPGQVLRLRSPGFLQGAAGVALALLAAPSDLPSSWDRVMLPGAA